MAYIKGAVYSPPEGNDLPYLAVVFSPDDEVLTTRKVSSILEGEAILQKVFTEIANESNLDIQIK